MRSNGEEISIRTGDNVLHLKSECIGSQIIDWNKNKKNIHHFLERYGELKKQTAVETLAEQYKAFEEDLSRKTTEGQEEQFPGPKEGIKNLWEIFIPTKNYFVTPLIINFNILIFIIMVSGGVHFLFPSPESLVDWGGNFRPETLRGQAWRLLSSCFMHAGLLHLVMNIYALCYIGLLIEPLIGRAKFLGAYLLSGIAASLASLWWHPLTVSVGASGAIFGMYGLFLAMLSTRLIEKAARKALLSSIGIFVVFNLVSGMKAGIDNAAHIGGLIFGLLMGYAFYPSLREKKDNIMQYSAILCMGTALFIAILVGFRSIPNDMPVYEKTMQDFAAYEKSALEVFQLSEDTPQHVVLYEIKERGLYYWGENIKLIKELEKLDLPGSIRDRNRKLLEYCQVRIKSYELLYKTVAEDTEQYQAEMEKCGKKIEQLIQELENQNSAS